MSYPLVKFCFCVDPLFEIRMKSICKLKPLQVLLILIPSFFWTSYHPRDKYFLLLSGSLVSLSIFNQWPYWMLLENKVLCELKGLFTFFRVVFVWVFFFVCPVVWGFFLVLLLYLLLLSFIDLWGMAFLFKSCGDFSPFQQISYLLIQLFRVVRPGLPGTNHRAYLVCSTLADPRSSVKLDIESGTFQFCGTEAIWISWTIDKLCVYTTISLPHCIQPIL